MATSVKMRERDKRRLDRLQGELTVLRGRKMSQQEILSWLLQLGEGAKRHLAEDAGRPMTDREIAAMERLVLRTGIRTREEEIDLVFARESG